MAAGLALLALVLGMPGCAPNTAIVPQTSTTAPPTTGSLAADFTAHDLEGKSIRLSSLFGTQVVLLSFSVTFCEPCIAELPHLRRMYEENKANGFVILGIAMDGPETIANVPAFARRNQVSFPMISDQDSRISVLYNPRKAAPMSVLIDRSGKIAMVRTGYTPGDEDLLAEEVARALAEPAGSH